MADDAGFGDFKPYNNDTVVSTPNFNRISEQGVLFNKAYSPGTVCTQTRYGLLTGRYHFRTGQRGTGVIFDYTNPIIGDEPTIQSKLVNQGYRTYCSGKWHLGIDWKEKDDLEETSDGMFRNESIDFSSDFNGPTDKGFDRFYGIRGSLDMPPYCFLEDGHIVGHPIEEKENYYNQQRKGPESRTWDDFQVGKRITSKALSYISQGANSESPFFLYVPTSSPHRPCLPPDYINTNSNGSKREDMVTHFDWTIGCIDEQLSQFGINDNTILIVTSDHGPNPSEKNIPHDPTNGLRGDKGSLYQGGFRIPLVLRYPNANYKNEISDPVNSVDIYPTICDILNINKPDGIDGQSFYNLLKGEKNNKPRHIITEDGGGRIAVQESGWKYIQPDKEDKKGELYNISEDFKETEDLVDQKKDKLHRLTNIIDNLDIKSD